MLLASSSAGRNWIEPTSASAPAQESFASKIGAATALMPSIACSGAVAKPCCATRVSSCSSDAEIRQRMWGRSGQGFCQYAISLRAWRERQQHLALCGRMKRQFAARPHADLDCGGADHHAQHQRAARRGFRQHDRVTKQIAQLAHRPRGQLNEIGPGRVMSQQAAARPARITRRHWILHEITALDQRQQMTVHGAFGEAEPFGDLGDAELLIGEGDRLQDVERDLHRAHPAIPAFLRQRRQFLFGFQRQNPFAWRPRRSVEEPIRGIRRFVLTSQRVSIYRTLYHGREQQTIRYFQKSRPRWRIFR